MSTVLPTMTGQTFTGLPATTKGTDKKIESTAWEQYLKTPKLQQYVRTQYGYVGQWLLTEPTLGPIIVASAMHGWDEGRFDAAVMATKWWKSTSQAQRNWQELNSSNPGEVASEISQMELTIRSIDQSIGLSIPNTQLKGIATKALEFNWSSTVLEQVLRRTYYKATSSPQVGQSATFADQARQLAGEYLIHLTTKQLGQLVANNQFGYLTADGLQATFAKKAMAMFPWMRESIQQGVTPAQYLSGWASAAGQTLGIDSSDVNWTTPKWMKALMTQPTGKSTTTGPVNVGVFQQNLMRTPSFGYSKTQGARDSAFSLADQVLQQFGKVR